MWPRGGWSSPSRNRHFPNGATLRTHARIEWKRSRSPSSAIGSTEPANGGQEDRHVFRMAAQERPEAAGHLPYADRGSLSPREAGRNRHSAQSRNGRFEIRRRSPRVALLDALGKLIYDVLPGGPGM